MAMYWRERITQLTKDGSMMNDLVDGQMHGWINYTSTVEYEQKLQDQLMEKFMDWCMEDEWIKKISRWIDNSLCINDQICMMFFLSERIREGLHFTGIIPRTISFDK